MNEPSQLCHKTPSPAAGTASFQSLPVPAVFSGIPQSGDDEFDRAIRVVFHHEGHYSNDPDDPGGPTAWGWSLRTAKTAGDLDLDGFHDFDIDLDGDVDIHDIRKLDAARAVELYHLHWWKKYSYDRLPSDIGLKTFDLAIVMGSKQAHKLLQRAVRAASELRPVDDGIIGRKTLAAVCDCNQSMLLAALRSEAAGFFRLLADHRPSSRKYLNGWLNRAYY